MSIGYTAENCNPEISSTLVLVRRDIYLSDVTSVQLLIPS